MLARHSKEAAVFPLTLFAVGVASGHGWWHNILRIDRKVTTKIQIYFPKYMEKPSLSDYNRVWPTRHQSVGVVQVECFKRLFDSVKRRSRFG